MSSNTHLFPLPNIRIISIACLMIILAGCSDDDNEVNNDTSNISIEDVVQRGDIRSLALPGGSVESLPETGPAVDTNKAELGRLLFWDPILSGDQDVACATCHLPERGYGDDLDISIGVGGVGQANDRTLGHVGFAPRNAQTLINTAFNGIDENGVFNAATAPMFWDSRVQSLETQALDPIQSRVEMRGDAFTQEEILDTIVARLNNNVEYINLFQQAYNTGTITRTELADALASFQRTLIANNSPFDRWMRGDATAMSDNALVGMREFTSIGCIDCHSGPMFSDYENHVLGIAENSKRTTIDDGDGNFAFRTPTLRNASLTAPYMHNGRFATLREAVRFYNDSDESQNPNVPNSALDPDVTGFNDIEGQRLDRLVDFINSLTDENFDKTRPETVPSGLNPGGNI